MMKYHGLLRSIHGADVMSYYRVTFHAVWVHSPSTLGI